MKTTYSLQIEELTQKLNDSEKLREESSKQLI
jgi:hypothetical protein